MKLKAGCFVALLFAAVVISSAATEASKDEKKSATVATDKDQDQARAGNFEEGKYGCWCCGRYNCPCCPLVDAKQAETVMEKSQAAEGTTHYGGGGGWGGGGRGGGGWGGGGRGGGGGRCPHCTAEEAAEMARGGKP